jgi:NADPH2:quinone reductase
MLELLREAGVKAIGAASKKHHALLEARGAAAIEGRSAPIDDGARAIAPDGVDASFDGIGGASAAGCVKATKRGGTFVCYGFTAGVESNWATMRGAWALFVGAPLSGRKGKFYGITKLYREDPKPFHEDLPKVLALLKDKKIEPRIVERLPLLDVKRAQQMLEAGGVAGKIVLVADA